MDETQFVKEEEINATMPKIKVFSNDEFTIVDSGTTVSIETGKRNLSNLRAGLMHAQGSTRISPCQPKRIKRQKSRSVTLARDDAINSPTGFSNSIGGGDVSLFNHPQHGFLLNLSEFRGLIVIYGSRSLPPGDPSALINATKLAALLGGEPLPELPLGAARPKSPAIVSKGLAAGNGGGEQVALVVAALDGLPMRSFGGLDGALRYLKGAGEFVSWRIAPCSSAALAQLPPSCRFQASTAEPPPAFCGRGIKNHAEL